MRRQRSPGESGQALIMVTLALIAMSGLIGLAVDFGWSFYVRRAAQAAADAAALAAANKAWDLSGGTSVDCSTLTCQSTPADCSGSPGGNLQFACQYAAANGFSSGGDSGRQTVTVTADVTSPAPTAPGVTVYYWVTVRVTNTIPQLYSAVLGNANATIAARATAAIVNKDVRASLIALNRENDAGPNGTGVDLKAGINTGVQAANGMFLASNIAGTGMCTVCLGVTGYPSGPAYTLIRNGGTISPTSTNWTWQNQSDGAPFYDPMKNMGQPPLASTSTTPIAVPNGVITTTGANAVCPNGVCAGGAYYATAGSGACPTCATGAPITIPTGTTVSFSDNSKTFPDYFFFGGLHIVGATVSFGTGQYVLAGVSGQSTSSTDYSTTTNYYALSISSDPKTGTGAVVTGGTGSDAGRLFINTATSPTSSYPGLDTVTAAVNAQLPAGNQLPTLYYGPAVIGAPQSSSTPDTTSTVTLYGLNSGSTQVLPSAANSKGYTLNDFAPTLFWQDQGFSNVKYTSGGSIDTSCGSLDSPCTNSSPLPSATPFLLFDTRTPLNGGQTPLNMNGTVYQPRGSWARLGKSTKMSAMQLISGAFDFSVSQSDLTWVSLPPLPQRRLQRAVALIE